MIFNILLSRSVQTPNSNKNTLQTFVPMEHKSTFGVHYGTGSPGQLGPRVAGFPGHCVAGSQNVTQFHVCFTSARTWRSNYHGQLKKRLRLITLHYIILHNITSQTIRSIKSLRKKRREALVYRRKNCALTNRCHCTGNTTFLIVFPRKYQLRFTT